VTVAARDRAGADAAILTRTAVRPDWHLDGERLLAIGAAISAAIVLGTFIGSGLIVMAAAGVAFVAAVFYPPIGLVVVAFMAPLRPPQSVPAPGFMMILVGAILLGCIFRLSIDRPHFRARPALLLILAFVLYVSAQQLPQMASGYAGVQAHDIGYLYFQLLTGPPGSCCRNGRRIHTWSRF
jgi:hypothetical protein